MNQEETRKPVSTLEERLASGIYSVSDLQLNTTTISFAKNHALTMEREELRTRVEALQKENEDLKVEIKLRNADVQTTPFCSGADELFREELLQENRTQAKRIAELEDVVKINHEWHKEHDDSGGYMGSAVCNKNTSVLALLQPLTWVK